MEEFRQTRYAYSAKLIKVGLHNRCGSGRHERVTDALIDCMEKVDLHMPGVRSPIEVTEYDGAVESRRFHVMMNAARSVVYAKEAAVDK